MKVLFLSMEERKMLPLAPASETQKSFIPLRSTSSWVALNPSHLVESSYRLHRTSTHQVYFTIRAPILPW